MKTENEQIAENVISRKGSLKQERQSFMSHWQEINRFLAPRSGRFVSSDRNNGGKRHQEIINETALFSRRTLQSGMMAGMSSAVRPWFVLGPPDPGMKDFAPVRDWLDTVTKIMREVYVRSNLYSVLPKMYGTCADYATAAFGLQEDQKEVFRCYPFAIGSFMIDLNDRMLVDTVYLERSMTVRQIVERFGEYDRKTGAAKWENISPAVKREWDAGNYGSWIEVTQAIEPNRFREKGKLNSRDKEFLSVYLEDGAPKGAVLRASGFDEFPSIVSRWFVEAEDIYGTDCPGMLALGSQKALQLEEKRKYQAIDKLVNPPMNADATLRNTGVDLLPGGVNWINNLSQSANSGLRPVYEINPHIAELSEDIREVENRIRRAYYEDLMLMFAQSDSPQMTAREVTERHEEKLLVLGPLMEQLNDDLFDPLIDRTFMMMLRRGMFPPAPPELQGKPLRVEYISIMAQAQKLIGVASVERFIGFVTTTAEAAGKPELLDKVNFDQTVDDYAEMTGVSSKMVRSTDDVKGIREQRAQAERSQQLAAAMPAVSQGATAAKTLSETDVNGVSALSRLMTGVSGGQ